MSELLQAINDAVIIKPRERINQSHSGIIVADMSEDRPEIGEIISVGPGAYSITGNYIPTTLEVGQIVVVPKFGASQLTIEGEDYIITTEKEIRAIIGTAEQLQNWNKNQLNKLNYLD